MNRGSTYTQLWSSRSWLGWVVCLLLALPLSGPAFRGVDPLEAGARRPPFQAATQWVLVGRYERKECSTVDHTTMVTMFSCLMTSDNSLHIERQIKAKDGGSILQQGTYSFAWTSPPTVLADDFRKTDSTVIELNVDRSAGDTGTAALSMTANGDGLIEVDTAHSLQAPVNGSATARASTRLNSMAQNTQGYNPLAGSQSQPGQNPAPDEMEIKFVASAGDFYGTASVTVYFLYRKEPLAAGPTPRAPIIPIPTCPQLNAGPVTWVTLDAERNIDQEAVSYPYGVAEIDPAFDYNCVPPNTSLAVILNRDQMTILNKQVSINARDSAGTYLLPIKSRDKSPLAAGRYAIQFYQGNKLLTSGATTIEQPAVHADTAAVHGTVIDSQTRNPIPDALIYVLLHGYTAQQWFDQGMPAAMVFGNSFTNSQGRFILYDPVTMNERRLKRSDSYPLVVYADGYRTLTKDDFVLGSAAPDPAFLTIRLSK